MSYPNTPETADFDATNTVDGQNIVSRQNGHDVIYQWDDVAEDWTNVTPAAEDFPESPGNDDLWEDMERGMGWVYVEDLGKWRAYHLGQELESLAKPQTYKVTIASGTNEKVVEFARAIDRSVEIAAQVTVRDDNSDWASSVRVRNITNMSCVVRVGTTTSRDETVYLTLSAVNETAL